MNYELPSAPLSIGGVLDNAIRLYRHALRRCWILSLIYGAVLGAFGAYWELAVASVVGPDGRANPLQLAALLLSPLTIGGFLVAIVLSMALHGALVKTEVAAARGDESLTLGMAIAAGLKRLPGVLLASILSMLAVGIGFLLLIVPGIYVFGKLQLWIVAMFVEDASALDSLKISWRLTDKRWWRAATILTVAIILIYAFALTFGIVAALITAVAHVSVGAVIVKQSLSIVSNIIVLPMTVAIAVVMYHDFKLRSEGGDLAVRMGSLGKA